MKTRIFRDGGGRYAVIETPDYIKTIALDKGSPSKSLIISASIRREKAMKLIEEAELLERAAKQLADVAGGANQ